MEVVAEEVEEDLEEVEVVVWVAAVVQVVEEEEVALEVVVAAMEVAAVVVVVQMTTTQTQMQKIFVKFFLVDLHLKLRKRASKNILGLTERSKTAL
jgi:hypothetical protein